MTLLQRSPRSSQENIFASYNWYDQRNLLNLITIDRINYVESRLERTLGKGAFAQQEPLEVGCGGGLLCLEMARRGLMVTGIDPSQGALETARQHVDEYRLGHNVAFDQGYAESLPYADNSFSVVVCMDVLEHVQEPRAAIREIGRVLAPGGLFFFDTINRTLLARLALIWIGERFFQKQGLQPGLHDYAGFIKPAELRRDLAQSKLEVQELTGFMPGFVEGRLTLTPGWFKGVSYVGYARKTWQ